MTDNSPMRWHSNANRALRDSGDTIDMHQRRVTALCLSLAAHIGHVVTGRDLLHAALHHDEAERVIGDMPSPAKARFPALALEYEAAEAVILSEMGLTWTLTDKEQTMLRICDKLDAYTWSRKHGATGPEWDDLLVALLLRSLRISASDWVMQQIKENQ